MNFFLEISLHGIYVVRGGGFTDGVKQHVGQTQEPSPSGALTILSGKSPHSTSSDVLAIHEVFFCHSIKSEGQRSASIMTQWRVRQENSAVLSPAFLFSVFFTRDSWTSWSYCTVKGVESVTSNMFKCYSAKKSMCFKPHHALWKLPPSTETMSISYTSWWIILSDPRRLAWPSQHGLITLMTGPHVF